jgi:hypothetical protein
LLGRFKTIFTFTWPGTAEAFCTDEGLGGATHAYPHLVFRSGLFMCLVYIAFACNHAALIFLWRGRATTHFGQKKSAVSD